MAFIRRAFLSLKRRYMRTLILFVILLIMGVFEVVGLTLSNAAASAKNDTLRQIGAAISIGSNQKYIDKLNKEAIASGYVRTEEGNTQVGGTSFTVPIITSPIVTDAMIDKIEKIPHVTGINYYSGYYGSPANFSNVKDYEGVNPATQKVNMPFTLNNKDDVVIDGNSRVDLTDAFIRKEASIVKGVFPTAKEPGALIEERLASKNSLKPGDTIQVAPAVKTVDSRGVRIASGEATPVSMKVVGIYRTTDKFKILDTNPEGEAILAASPYNRIYTDYETGRKIFDPGPRIAAYIYIDSPENINSTAGRIKRLDFDWNKYELSLMSMFYSGLTSQLDTVASYAFTVTLIATIIGAVILLLIMSLWSKNYVYETGLLLALGEKKWKIVAQHLTEVLVITIAALVIAGFIGTAAARKLGGQTQNPPAAAGGASVGSFDTGTAITQQPMYIKTDMKEAAGIAGIGLALVLVSTTVPGILILRYKPRKILSKSE